MGKILDRIYESAETKDVWLLRDNHVAPAALKGKSIPLPAPYNRRNGVLEADTMKRVREVLQSVPDLWWRRIEGSGKLIHTGPQQMQLVKSSMQGMPDFIALHQGVMLGLEVKAPGGHLAPEQKSCLEEMTLAGGLGMVVVDPEKLANWFASEESAVAWGKVFLI